ncbi:MAG: glucose-1-phosphate thymidylyltransferase [Bacteroidales bacterium]|nr:glucose-1-phosphate thymidylyltransferase [Bacteroidales bacterium]
MEASVKNFILFDDETWSDLLPLTFTRPVSELRMGILTIKEKWEKWLNAPVSYMTQPYLSEKYTLTKGNENVLINSSITPSMDIVQEILTLEPGNLLISGKTIVASNSGNDIPDELSTELMLPFKYITVRSSFFKLNFPWEIFLNNGTELVSDYNLLTRNRVSAPISSTNQVIKPENVFIEEGASVECSILNATPGPIYIGKDAEVMEGSIVRGPFALCEHSSLKLGAKVYGPSTIGPHSKVGGEVNNSVIIGYSNKAHDGFLGNSVIGEWCNLGADTNTSNLKNNYAPVKVWSYTQETFMDTGLQFCGLVMGDHSKSGINTMFNTGTVVGISANIFGAGFPRSFIPSFSWGGSGGFTTYSISKAFETIEIVMKRRGLEFNKTDRNIIEHIFNLTFEFKKKV